MVIYPSLSVTGHAGSSISGTTDDGQHIPSSIRETTGDYESVTGTTTPLSEDGDFNEIWDGTGEDAWSVISDDEDNSVENSERFVE